MKITTYQSLTRDLAGEELDLSWSQLAEMLTRPHARLEDKQSGPMWHAATKVGTRTNKNIRTITAAVFDVDKVSEEYMHGLLSRVEASGLAAIFHTSHGHAGPVDCRFRLVLRTSRPMLPAEWPVIRTAMIKGLDIQADPVTGDLQRVYWLPSCPPAPVAEPVSGTSDGDDEIDVDAVLGYQLKAQIEAAQAAATVPAAATALAAVAPGEISQNAKAFFDSEGAVDLDAIRDALRKYNGNHREVMISAMRGNPIAETGSRDNTIHRIMSAAAFVLPLEIPDTAVLEVFKDSILPLGPDWIPVALDKLERARQRKAETRAAERVLTDRILASVRKEAAAVAPIMGDSSTEELGPLPEKYTDDQLAKWAGAQGCDSVEGFRRRWIIQNDTAFYVFAEGKYLSPISKESLPVSLSRDLVRAPITLTTQTAAGLTVRRPASQILEEHATVARKIECRLDLQSSYYDAQTQKFYEAVCPLRPLQPIEHPEVDKWLRLLGGSQAEKVLDWCATVTQLDRQNPAIYVDGGPGAGKTLLAVGLSRLWDTGGPSSMNYILQGFNDSLIRCPLVLADEKLPDTKGITAQLREFLGSTSRTLSRKFLPTARLVGAPRVVIAANNERLLETNEELSANDLEAVAGRFLYVLASSETSAYLDALGGPQFISQRWVSENAIAEHALWLQRTRKIDRTKRFLVQSTHESFHGRLATSSGISGAIGEWLVKFLSRPAGVDNPLIQVGSGELWVNVEAISNADTWEKYMGNPNVPNATRASRALRLLSIGPASLRFNDRTVDYQRIKVSLILDQAANLQIGDLAAIKARIENPNERIKVALSNFVG